MGSGIVVVYDPPRLAERIHTEFAETFGDWLLDQGIVVLMIFSLLVRIWQELRGRPEVEFMKDLLIGTGVAYVFSFFIRVFTTEITHHSHEAGGLPPRM